MNDVREGSFSAAVDGSLCGPPTVRARVWCPASRLDTISGIKYGFRERTPRRAETERTQAAASESTQSGYGAAVQMVADEVSAIDGSGVRHGS
jgi:hypothetical protein